ncbi:hypothetical protein [Foetidibacter luteolus]|nr:hypothetical protein [Foetidibacter luteolus]
MTAAIAKENALHEFTMMKACYSLLNRITERTRVRRKQSPIAVMLPGP